MLTLHTVTQDVRTAAKWVGLVIGAILILMLLLGLGKNIKEFFFPTPLPPPTVSFGKLPEVLFPQSTVSQNNLNYFVNTLSGSLPNLPDRATIYPMEKSPPSLLALQRAQDKVAQLGFQNRPLALSNTMYQWNDSGDLDRQLVMNIIDNNFTLTSDYVNNPTVLAAQNLPRESDATKLAESFAAGIGGLPEDIDLDKTKTTLFSIQSSTLVPSTSFSNTQVVRVDFYQGDIGSVPVVYAHPPYANISFFITAGKYNGQVAELDFQHQAAASGSASATYPIITAKEAFDDLKKGNAYIPSYDGGSNQVSIKDVFLAYYVGPKDQDYLWPVIVFKGDNNFYAYIPALKPEWVKKANGQ